MNEYEAGLLKTFSGTEYGKLYVRLLQEEIRREEDNFDLTAKVSNDPISEDWRFKRGMIAGLKRALKLPEQYQP